jgi:hypothetical protein
VTQAHFTDVRLSDFACGPAIHLAIRRRNAGASDDAPSPRHRDFVAWQRGILMGAATLFAKRARAQTAASGWLIVDRCGSRNREMILRRCGEEQASWREYPCGGGP